MPRVSEIGRVGWERRSGTFDSQAVAKLEEIGRTWGKAMMKVGVVFTVWFVVVIIIVVVFVVQVVFILIDFMDTAPRGICAGHGLSDTTESWSGRSHELRGLGDVAIVVGKLFEFFVVGVVENFEFLFDGGSFAATDRTGTRMFLLLFHFPQDGLLFHLDERTTFILAEFEPELFDIFSFGLSGGVPDLVAGEFVGGANGGIGEGRDLRFGKSGGGPRGGRGL